MLHAVLFSLLWLQTPLPAPAAQRSTGLILGRVIDAGSGKPLAGVIVTITGATLPRTPPPPRVMTDAQGRFLYRNLPPGSYGITATRPGYIDGAYGRRRHDGGAQQVELGERERATDVTIVLWKFGAIGGTVVDEAGQPVVGVQVRALRRRVVAGQTVLSPNGVTLATDDRGVYRIANLPPGDYFVHLSTAHTNVPPSVMDAYQAAPGSTDPARRQLTSALNSAGLMAVTTSGGNVTREADAIIALPRGLALPNSEGAPAMVYPPTYHPGVTTLAQATVVRVGSGEERAGVDIHLRPAPVITVSGTVMRPDGPAAHFAVRLEAPGSPRGFQNDGYNTVTDGSGRFTLLGVAAGDYVLRVTRIPSALQPNDSTSTTIQSGSTTVFSVISGGASGPLPTDPTWWAAMPLQAGRQDITGLQLQLQQGIRFAGRVEFDGAAERPDADRLRRMIISVSPLDQAAISGNRSAQVDPDGRFHTLGLPAGKYFVRVLSPVPGWTFKSATYEGRDLADVPIEATGGDINGIVVTFIDRPGEIAGHVRGAAGPDPDATVLMFPSDPALWTLGVNTRKMRQERVNRAGAYAVKGLPPGSYYVIAVPDESTSGWNEAPALAAFARDATPIDIGEGTTKSQDLRTVRGRDR